MFIVPLDVAGSLRRVARTRMRMTGPVRSSDGTVAAARRVIVERRREVVPWLGVAGAVAALVWLFCPQALAPDVLRHLESARGFIQVLWQVLAAGLALSTGIVAFSFSAFASTRLFELGAKLSDFARSSGLLIGIAVGLLALVMCGVWLLALPSGSEPHVLTRAEYASAVAVCLLGLLALMLIAYVLRLALRAGDREWVQRLLRTRIENYLDETVRDEVEHGHARVALSEIVSRFGLRAPKTSRPVGYRALPGIGEGVVVDIKLRTLVRLSHVDDGSSQLVLNPLIELFPLAREITRSTEPVWTRSDVNLPERRARRVFKVRREDTTTSVTDDLDRLNRQGQVAIRDDDEPWYREVTAIYRGALLHMIAAWSRYGPVPVDEPFGHEVGLVRCREDLRSHLQEIVKRERNELAHLAPEVPLSVALAALERGDEGIRLAYRMEQLLEDMAVDATKAGSAEAAHTAAGYASSGLFMLLRAAAEGL